MLAKRRIRHNMVEARAQSGPLFCLKQFQLVNL